MGRRALPIACFVCLASCETTDFQQGDQTSPSLFAAFVDPSALRATYDVGGGAVDRIHVRMERPFSIVLRSDSKAVTMLFSAADRESGVRRVDAGFSARFRCGPGQAAPRSDPDPVIFEDHFVADPREGPRVRVVGLAVVRFTLEQLWIQGCQPQLGGTTGHISGLEIEYGAVAWNHAAGGGADADHGGGASEPLRGTFRVVDPLPPITLP